MQHNIHKLIDTLAHAEAALRGQLFLAPMLARGRARLRVGGLLHELAVAGAQPGWWLCRALDTTRAAAVEPAPPWLRGAYLALWPALRLVLAERLRDGDWVALPFNPADALQRFGLRGPLVVRLVEGGQPFERVVGRVEGATIWYDAPDRRGDPQLAERLRAALAAGELTPALAGLSPGERAAYALLAARHAVAHTEQRLRAALELGGARLLGYEPCAAGLRVLWERDGRRSTTLVGANLDVIAAGICLSGEDQRFDLASIVGVVHDAPDFALT